MTRLFAVFLIAFALLFPALILAQGLLPEGAKDLFALLVAWPRSPIEYAFLISAWCGVFGHWWNKRRLSEHHGNFIDYLMAERSDAALSIATVVMIWAAIMGLIVAGLVANAAMSGAIAGGFAVGWLIDSLVQKKAG
ncbi:MAG TPA: hypothetical protein VJT81_06500 [Burkholderiales bacterium]|nr:hypothetical protein [Burkholderiales bacterium]